MEKKRKEHGSKPIIAIIGRPNVGKSTLFNRLVGFRKAIESEFEGTTRDRIFHNISIGSFDMILVDTGGLEFDSHESIEEDVQLQARIAIEDADLILLLLSAKEMLTSRDYEAVELLRKSSKEVILVANKCDTAISRERIIDFYSLGFDEPIAISAIHNSGIDELQDKIIEKLISFGFDPFKSSQREISNKINIAFAGRPNVGKSSLVNAFLNEEKLIVSDISGTTRDSVDTEFQYKDNDFVFIDTAGIRRPGKRTRMLEKYSVLRSLQAIGRSDIALLIIDFTEKVSHQDCYISQAILESFAGLIIVVNKSDMMKDKEKDMNKFIYNLKGKMSYLAWAPVVFVSAKNKKNINKILDLAVEIKAARLKRIATSQFNDFIAECIRTHSPSGTKVKKPKILYASQVEINPPHFVLFVNDVSAFHFSYRRYLENKIRDRYGFEGTPIKIDIKDKEGVVEKAVGKRRTKES